MSSETTELTGPNRNGSLGRKVRVVGAVVVGAVLVIGGYLYGIVDSDSGSSEDDQSDDAASGVADKCENDNQSGVDHPDEGVVSIAEKGAYHESGSDEVWFGAVVQNSSTELAYHVSLEFKLLDKDCEQIGNDAFRKAGSAAQNAQTVPVVAPDNKEGLGGYVRLNDASTSVEGVRVEIKKVDSWMDAQPDTDNYLTDRAVVSDVVAGIDGSEMNVYLRLNGGGRFSSPSNGVAFVFRDSEKRIVGGSPPVRIEGEVDHLSHKVISVKVPKPADLPREADQLEVDVVNTALNGVYVYPEYLDTKTGDLVTPG